MADETKVTEGIEETTTETKPNPEPKPETDI